MAYYEQPYGGGGFGPSGAGPRSGGGPRRDLTLTEGKLFLGGLDNSTSKETLLQYCQQWYDVCLCGWLVGRNA
jgi:hypothetical protein